MTMLPPSLRFIQMALGLGACLGLASAHSGTRGSLAEADLIGVKTGRQQLLDNGDGTLTDRTAQITWMRCSLGQRWDEWLRTCQGNPLSMSLDQARRAVQQVNQSATFHQDWRLPSLTEMARITSSRSNPDGVRISQRDFPATPANFFWTSSAKASGDYEPLWYAMSFGYEGLKAVPADSKLFVRLVRYGN